MSRLAILVLVISSMMPLEISPLRAQSTSPGTAASGNSNSGNASSSNSSRNSNTQQSIRFVSGQVLSESGQKIRESITANLACNTRSLQAVHADLSGNFLFSLGPGAQGNLDVSAAENSRMSAASSAGISPMGRADSVFGNGSADLSVSNLMGCEIRISAPGYKDARSTITQQARLGTVDIGVLILKPTATAEESTISVTTLRAPDAARKEFEKGLKDINQNLNESAAQHLEKAVAQYDRFAAAWFELGKLYTASDPGKARHAFEKAIAADDHFVDSFTRLAALQLDAQDNLDAIQSSSRALQIQPLNNLANFIHAAANYNLDRLDEAEKSARLAGQTPNGYLPQLHALLANILLRKEDYPNAILEMHAYLQEAPSGTFAPQIKRNLERLQNAGFDTTSASASGH